MSKKDKPDSPSDRRAGVLFRVHLERRERMEREQALQNQQMSPSQEKPPSSTPDES